MRELLYLIILTLISNEILGQDFCRYQPSDKNLPKGVKIEKFKQRIEATNTKDKWDQRYMVREDLWKKEERSPVFLMVSGEYEASTKFMTSGVWIEWAKKLGALVFLLEHRYYGESKPTPDLTTENLKYLTINNVVTDVPIFMSGMIQKYELTKKNQWIMFGGGYAGTIATWVKLKNAGVARGVIISGAPLEAKSDYFEYRDLVRTGYQESNYYCKYNISRAVVGIERKYKNKKGLDALKTEFNLCEGFDGKSAEDKKLLYFGAFKFICLAEEFNNGSDPKNKISEVCKVMDDDSMPNQDERLGKVYTQRTSECLEATYKDYVARYKKTAWSDPTAKDGSRQWLYQRCNELGLFFTTPITGSNFMPGFIPLTFYEKVCKDVFGDDFDKAHTNKGIADLNNVYGGWEIRVDNVTAIVGSLDPWRYLAIPRNPSEKFKLIYLEGLSHCQDMKTPSTKDPKNLADTRARLLGYLKTWIAA